MFLGIDLGTSSLKAVVIDHQHQVRATAGADLTVSHPNINWSEQNPAATIKKSLVTHQEGKRKPSRS